MDSLVVAMNSLLCENCNTLLVFLLEGWADDSSIMDDSAVVVSSVELCVD